MPKSHRGTIFCADARILEQTPWAGGQYVARLAAPDCARTATPGSFVHIRCGSAVPMRRPLSILRANADEGWIEILYKVMGAGLATLALAQPGDTVSVLGPIGRGFTSDPDRPIALLVGGGVGVPPLVFLAEALASRGTGSKSIVAFFGSELPFPFPVRPSRLQVPGAPPAAQSAMAFLEELGVPCRLASNAGIEGCYPGYVTELAEHFLAALPAAERARVTLYACGPKPMLRAAQHVAQPWGVRTQLCLEEFMACAVGGCAGCVVPVMLDGQRQMKRVCVDGPVFDGATVLL